MVTLVHGKSILYRRVCVRIQVQEQWSSRSVMYDFAQAAVCIVAGCATDPQTYLPMLYTMLLSCTASALLRCTTPSLPQYF